MFRLVLGGLLALPPLLLQVVLVPLVALLSLPAALVWTFPSPTAKKTKQRGAHVIVTGGSSGIGLALAELCVNQATVERVSILARNPKKLDEAKTALAKLNQDCRVDAVSVDVTNASALQKVAKDLQVSADTPIYLYCCAGYCYTDYFESLDAKKVLENTQTNQLGVFYTIQAFLPALKACPSGLMILCSSMAGQVGVFGFSAYSATKFALQGIAQALHMEICVQHPHLRVQVAFPPDTDTPGYALENEGKPPECALVSETVGLSQPADVARALLNQSLLSSNPPFLGYTNFDGYMLSALTAGFGPVSGVVDCLTQLSAAGLLRWVALAYLNMWWTALRKHYATSAADSTKADYGATKNQDALSSSPTTSTVNDDKKK